MGTLSQAFSPRFREPHACLGPQMTICTPCVPRGAGRPCCRPALGPVLTDSLNGDSSRGERAGRPRRIEEQNHPDRSGSLFSHEVGGVTEFSGKGPRRWLDSADSCLVHTNPPRPPNHTDAHFRPHSKCCPQGQPDPRAAGRLQVAWVSDWRTPSCAGDRVQVALRRSGARERQAPARRGSHPAALRRARRLTRAAHHVRPWRARNAGGPARLPEPRGWWPGRPVPRARGQC